MPAPRRGSPLLVILRALGLGDFLTAVPAYRALARRYPDHRRVLAAPSSLEPLARLTGAIHAVVPTQPLAPLSDLLRPTDVGVNLHGRGPQSHRALLASGPRRFISFANSSIPESQGMPPWRQGEHEVDRWCRLLNEIAIPACPTELGLALPQSAFVADAIGATLIHPGAASGSRCWPVERWVAVARRERRAGRRVILTGSPSEVERSRRVAQGSGLSETAIFAGKTDLMSLAALVATADTVICGDTGVAHLATAFGTPSIVLFGPSSPHEWGPPPLRRRHRVLWSGRTGDPHAVSCDEGLLSIQPRDVAAALEALRADDFPARGAHPKLASTTAAL
ncbi:MAG: glycosyltransferase family 9 protein [Candidatus Eremiobacteraeota bacterium]|nr:glycosyltransferase family 9 protein [Candidatus Eremiobacteraeota bacterium]MBC5826449.1 glycosyltransferase family 9 protein [Candidatus Eremiobacteraeota bacterium]